MRVIVKERTSSLDLMWSAFFLNKGRVSESTPKTPTNLLSPYWSPNYACLSRLERAGAGIDTTYLNARYMNPQVGQFMSQDPNFWNRLNLSDPQSQNSYSYANNNPIRLKDPEGLAASDPQRSPEVQAIIQAEIKRAQQQLVDRVNAMGQAARDGFLGAIGGAWDPIKGITSISNPSFSIPQRVGTGIGVGIGIFGGLGDVNALRSVGTKVITETLEGSGKMLSKFKLSGTEVLETAEDFLGTGYKQMGPVERGVYRSADGLRQFRMDPSSLAGSHNPWVPHVQYEVFQSLQSTKPSIINHVPFYDR